MTIDIVARHSGNRQPGIGRADSMTDMEVKSLSEALSSIMQERSCSQTQLGRDLGIGQSWVSDVIRGRVTSTGLAKVIQLLDRVDWEVCFRPKREESDPMKRRQFITGVTSATLVPSHRSNPHEDAQYVQLLGAQLKQHRDQLGGSALASSAMRNLNSMWTAITDDGRGLIDGNRSLKAAVSSFACETAWTTYDSGNYALTERTGRQALHLALSIKDLDVESRARDVMAEVSIAQGKADAAIAFADQGIRLSGVVPEVNVRFNALLARSLALVPGQKKNVFPILDRMLSGPIVGGAIGNGAVALSDMGLYAEAGELLDEAVRLAAQRPNLQANWVMRQLELGLRMGDFSMAAERMLALARIMPLLSSGRLESHVAEVLTASAHSRGAQEMREAREQLRSVMPQRTAPSRR